MVNAFKQFKTNRPLQGEPGTIGISGPKGDDGAKGAPGRQGFKGDTGAAGLDGRTGPKGAKGLKGPQGDDGREVELRESNTHVQWRYEGDKEWKNLFRIPETTGLVGGNGASILKLRKSTVVSVKSYRSETTATTFVSTDFHVEQQTSGITDTLPATTVASIKVGQIFQYSNVSAGSTTIQTTNSETINIPGSSPTSITVFSGESMTFQVRPDGGWKRI